MTYSTPPKDEAKWWLPVGLAFTAWANAVAAPYSNDFGGDDGWGRGSALEGLELPQNSGGSPAPSPGASPPAATPPLPSTPPGFVVAMDWSWRERSGLVGCGRSVCPARPDRVGLNQTAPSARPLGHVTQIGPHLSETPSTVPNDRSSALCKTFTECAVAFAKD